VWILGGQQITRWARRLCSSTGVAGLARRVWPGYLALLVVVQLVPFDFTISTAELAAKQEEGKIFLIPFASYAGSGLLAAFLKILVHGLCFAPLGFLRVLAYDSARPLKTSWPRVVLFGLMVSASVEGAQLFVYTRVFDATDILLGTLMIALGWHAGLLFRERWIQSLDDADASIVPTFSPLVWGTLVVAWLAIVLYLQWAPFDFSTDPVRFRNDPEDAMQYGLRRFSWLPLVDYYWGSKYNALDQLLKKALAFIPLGVLFAIGQSRLYRTQNYRRLLVTAALLALVIEVGRYFLPGRSPSTTDLLISCFGAWAGFTLVQHVRVVFWAERTLFAPLHREFGTWPEAFSP
jgi:glycopeptide antibiotics resistance protein